jgi:hypothetical protein
MAGLEPTPRAQQSLGILFERLLNHFNNKLFWAFSFSIVRLLSMQACMHKNSKRGGRFSACLKKEKRSL